MINKNIFIYYIKKMDQECIYDKRFTLEELLELFPTIKEKMIEVGKLNNKKLKDFNFPSDSLNLINYYHAPVDLIDEKNKIQTVNTIDYRILIEDFKNENFYFILESYILLIQENKVIKVNKIINEFNSDKYGFKKCLAIFNETVVETIKNNFIFFEKFYKYINPIIK